MKQDYHHIAVQPNSQYRTNSHAGLPQGSYVIPNPIHYHIARYGETAELMHPVFVKLGYLHRSQSYTFNSLREKNRPTVTINIGNSKTITLDISIQTLKEFIYPFANALNTAQVQESCTTGSQTSFVKNSVATSSSSASSLTSVTELCYKNNTLMPRKYSDQSDISEYERKIMQSLYDNLLAEVNMQKSDAELESENDETFINKNIANSNCDITTLAKHVIEKAQNIDSDLSVLEDVIYDALSISKNLACHDGSDVLGNGNSNTNVGVRNINENTNSSDSAEVCSHESWTSCTSNKSEVLISDAKADQVENHSIDINKNIVASTSNNDEGISLTLNTFYVRKSDALSTASFDENVIKMSDSIYDYLVKQCFEIKELVLFPELLYDDNVIKLYTQLQMYYENSRCDSFSNEDKTNLRFNIASRIMMKLEIDDRLADSDSSDNSSESFHMVTDKIFTITEFVSDILDNFFDKYVDQSLSNSNNDEPGDAEEFVHFAEDVQENDMVDQSTPNSFRCKNVSNSPENSDEDDDDKIVISFKTKKSKNLGNEKYWIAITKSPDAGCKKTPKKRQIINVDDIPLKPPPDLDVTKNVQPVPLSPIPEEAVCNLFPDFISSDSEEDSVIEANVDVTSENTYVAFERAERNTVVCNSVTFCRTNTVNAFSYIQANAVDFIEDNQLVERYNDSVDPNCSYNNNENNCDDTEDDWMGYERAKF